MGLAFYAPKGKTSIVVAPTASGVVASLVGDTGEIKDFRCLSKEKWKKESSLTICGWKTSLDIEVYSIGNVFIPQDVKNISVKLAQSVPIEMAVLNGIAQLYNKSFVETVIPVTDKTTENNKHKFFRSLLVPLAVAAVFTFVALGNAWFSSHSLNTQTAKIETEINTMFTEVLPNAPMVDAVAQISRRLSEVSYVSGEKIMINEPLTTQITALQKQLAEKDLSVKVSEMAISNSGFKFRGTLTSLSDVDKVKQALATATNKTVILHHAQMVQGTGVDFYMEAK
jgi:hypothetical protein